MNSSLQNVMTTQKRLELYLYRFFNLGCRRYWLSTPRADHLNPRERQPILIKLGVMWAPWPVWTGATAMDLAEYSQCQWSALISLFLLPITCHCWLVRPTTASDCNGFSRVFTVPMVCTHFFAPVARHLPLLVGSSP